MTGSSGVKIIRTIVIFISCSSSAQLVLGSISNTSNHTLETSTNNKKIDGGNNYHDYFPIPTEFLHDDKNPNTYFHKLEDKTKNRYREEGKTEFSQVIQDCLPVDNNLSNITCSFVSSANYLVDFQAICVKRGIIRILGEYDGEDISYPFG